MGKELKPVCKVKRKFQKGRGIASGLGKLSGRGSKGHRARAGYRVLMGFEGGQMSLFRRLPKFGFSNEMHEKSIEAVTLRRIDETFKDGEIVSLESLKEKGLISRECSSAKVITKGSLVKKVKFSPKLSFSRSAKEAVVILDGDTV